AVPDTLISQIALAAMVIGGVTTVLANANPLIPLDGYYALSDYLEIPNLRTRAFGYVGWLVRRYGLRLAVPPPPADPHERRAFVIYGTLAFLYSITILILVAVSPHLLSGRQCPASWPPGGPRNGWGAGSRPARKSSGCS